MTPIRPIAPSFCTTSSGNSLASSQRMTLGAISRAAKSLISLRNCSCSSVRAKEWVGVRALIAWAPSSARNGYAQSSKPLSLSPGYSQNAERLLQILEQIICIFDTRRDPHHAVREADFGPALFAQRRVRHGGGMGDQRLYPTQRFADRAYLEPAQHGIGPLQRTSLESNERPETRHLPLGQLMLGMAGQAGIKNRGDLRMAGEIFSDCAAIDFMLLHAHGQ